MIFKWKVFVYSSYLSQNSWFVPAGFGKVVCSSCSNKISEFSVQTIRITIHKVKKQKSKCMKTTETQKNLKKKQL